MSQVIGEGVIQVSADATKLKAGIDDAKRSIKTLGTAAADTNTKASASIDRYVQKLQLQASTIGKTAREYEVQRLALRGATQAQLAAADSALRMQEAYAKGAAIGQNLRFGLIAAAAVSTTVAIRQLASAVRDIDAFNDLNDATGASIENISALDRLARETGVAFESVAGTLVKFNQALNKSGDDGKGVGAVLKKIGLNADELKAKDPAQALLATAVAFQQFERDGDLARASQILFGKSIQEAAPFLKDLAEKGKLVGTVSEHSAAEVEKFNKEIFKLRANSEDLARSLSIDLVTGINAAAQAFRESGLISSIQTFLTGTDSYKNDKRLVQLTDDLLSAENALSKSRQKDSKFGDRSLETAANEKRLAAIKEELATVQSYRKVLDLGSTIAATEAPKKKIGVIPEPGKKGAKDNSAEQEAKAQLAYDLDQIRKAGDARINTIGNYEKVMEAQRSASLISEAEYYAQKRSFIEQDAAVQEDAITKEIALLQAQKVADDDKIDHKRKIADAEFKLAKIRENAATELKVLKVNETGALNAVTRAYEEAEAAAQSYLDVIRKTAQREIAGIGKGSKVRDFNAGISGIDDKFAAQEQDLQRDKRNGKFKDREGDYERELALIRSTKESEVAIYRAKYGDIEALQSSYFAGASEALANYLAESTNVARQTQEVFTSAFQGMEDALVGFITTGKLNYQSLGDFIVAQITRMIVKQMILNSLTSAMGGGTGSGLVGLAGSLIGAFTGTAGVASAASALPGNSLDNMLSLTKNFAGRAIGGPVSAGEIYRVNEKGPELLNIGGQQLLMMGNQSGTVEPRIAATGAPQRNLTLHYHAGPGESRATSNQRMADMMRMAQLASARNN